MLQKLAPSIITPLTHIINQSLCTGIFPHRLKIANVIPLFKKNVPHIFDNYRPISLLSSISKTFEKVVFNQVYEYFTNNELFYNSQYGFRKLHPNEYASLELVDRISQYLDNGKLPVTVYLDLSKAFDTINHEILFKKLEYYGFTDTPFIWFRSYLHNRHQYVFFNGCCSTPKTLETGVPHGSILGPLLFLIYMNDIKEACKNSFQSVMLMSHALSAHCVLFTMTKINMTSMKCLEISVMSYLVFKNGWISTSCL